jgi:hypothetical protein
MEEGNMKRVVGARKDVDTENVSTEEILELAHFLKANGCCREDARRLILGDAEYFREGRHMCK